MTKRFDNASRLLSFSLSLSLTLPSAFNLLVSFEIHFQSCFLVSLFFATTTCRLLSMKTVGQWCKKCCSLSCNDKWILQVWLVPCFPPGPYTTYICSLDVCDQHSRFSHSYAVISDGGCWGRNSCKKQGPQTQMGNRVRMCPPIILLF